MDSFAVRINEKTTRNQEIIWTKVAFGFRNVVRIESTLGYLRELGGESQATFSSSSISACIIPRQSAWLPETHVMSTLTTTP
jgi:hypothetical protein